MADVEQQIQVLTESRGWQFCEVIVKAIGQWREAHGINIPPGWCLVKIASKPAGVKWLPRHEAAWRLRLTSGDLNVRKEAAFTELAWHGIGEEPGLWVFRIEQFKVVPWPKEKYGQFHEGDSYVVLHTERQQNKLEWSIHFWIGKESTIDEQGTAAWKTTELDSYFNERASQTREVQDGESDAFRSYFNDELTYLPGGVPTGFRLMSPDLRSANLTQVWRDSKSGKGSMRYTQVPVDIKSLNHRDAFILEIGGKAYIWFGESCNAFVRQAANEAAKKADRTLIQDCGAEFWTALGGRGQITPATQVGVDVQVEFGEGVLYEVQIDDVTNKLTVEVKARGELNRSDLATDGVMMVDTRTEIFLWYGKDASTAERSNAFHIASKYLKENNREINTTSITILEEGHDRTSRKWMEMFPIDS